MEHHWRKKNIWATRGLEPASLVSVNRHAMLYVDHHASPKKDASSPELSNTVFSYSSNVNSHIMSDAIFVMQSIPTTAQ